MEADLTINLQKSLFAPSGKLTLQMELQMLQGERIAITGASGSGKTTILRMLAGLTQPDAGSIHWKSKTWFDAQQKIALPPQQRPVGFLFQNYALFPNMTVRQNLEYARERKQSKAMIAELLEVMELSELEKRYPNTLSGGQQQRVALARALVRQPEILLLDEPLSALDAEMRTKLQNYILKMHTRFGLTTIWVSHDRKEVEKVAQRIFQLHEGTLQPVDFQQPEIEINGVIESLQTENDQRVITIRTDLHPPAPQLTPGKKVGITLKNQ